MIKQIVSATALLLVAAQTWAATECSVTTMPFPATSDTRQFTCQRNVNTVSARAFHTSSSADSKAVAAHKVSGTQTTFVNGVDKNGAPLQGCGVRVNDPADGEKQDTTGCLNATQWRVRMFDS